MVVAKSDPVLPLDSGAVAGDEYSELPPLNEAFVLAALKSARVATVGFNTLLILDLQLRVLWFRMQFMWS